MTKSYNFRFESDLIKQLDLLDGSRTFNVRNAIQTYLQKGYTNNYNVDLVDILKSQIIDLKEDKKYLQTRLDAYMIMKTPLLQRVIEKIKQS